MYKKILIFTVFAFFIAFNSASANEHKKNFKDIPSNYVYINEINAMIEQGIISGYPDNTFRPNDFITRSHAAKLINKTVTLKKVQSFTKPKDLPENHAYYNDFKKFIEAGLFELDAKGNINPNQPLTRGEMAKILSVAFELINHTYDMPLTDVSKNISKYVHALYDSNITTGFSDNTFREKEPVTRVHYTVFMNRAMKYKNLPPLATLTDAEIEKLSTPVLIQYIEPLRYNFQAYSPKGVTDLKRFTEELTLEFKKTAVLVRNSGYTSFSYYGGTERSNKQIIDSLKYRSNIFGTDLRETIELFNKLFKEGVVISSLDTLNEKQAFAMMYNYTNGRVEMYIDHAYDEIVNEWYIQAYLKTGDYKSLNELKIPNKKLGAKLLTEQLQQQYAELKTKENFSKEDRYNMINNRNNLEDIVRGVAAAIQKSPGEVITLFNIAYQTGVVVSNKEIDPIPYTLYFDFVDGHIVFGAN